METAIINGICRCCASEGAFKDIRSAYQWMGAEEIYADMLKECFDLSLWSSGEGDDGGICEVCVTQLRNASNFKKQVLHTEEQFKKHLHTRLFKPSIVKVELPANDGIDSDDNISAEEGYSGTDYEVSAIKVESPEESKPKKRSAKMSTRASTSRAKKAKGDAGESSTKRIQPKVVDHNQNANSDSAVILIVKSEDSETPNLETEKETQQKVDSRIELSKHRENLTEILKHSNATLILKMGKIGYRCAYCVDEYPKPADLKKHTLIAHNNTSDTVFKATPLGDYIVKLDITDLCCTLCHSSMESLQAFQDHLISEHNRTIYTNIKSHIVPFKFDTEILSCCLCLCQFDRFKNLQEHMHQHFRNYICNICGSGYVYMSCLTRHKHIHKKGKFPCSYCPKICDTRMKKKMHERSTHTHTNSRIVCGYCNEGFRDHKYKMLHLSEVHGVIPPTPQCNACNRSFDTAKNLRIHIRKYHLLEKRKRCTECDMTFFSSTELKNHMLTHTGEKKFQCEYCFKCYGRKSTLREHLRIHNNDRRFKCEHCPQTFVQKCSWKGHLKSKHGEIV